MWKFILAAELATHLAVLVLLLLTAIMWYYWYVQRPYAKFQSYRVESRLPVWILMRKQINNVFFHKLIDLSKRYEAEGMFVAWIGAPYLFVYGEEIVKLILSDPASVDKPKTYELFEIILGKGLLTSNGESWKKQRKLVNPAFRVIALKEHMSIMNENADAFVKQVSELKGQPTDEIIDILLKYSLRFVVESTFGRKYCIDDKKIEEKVLKITEFLIYRASCPWLYFDFSLRMFPYARKILGLIKEITNVTKQVVKEAKESVKARQKSSKAVETEENFEFFGRNPKSFSEILVEQHLQDPSFSEREMCHQLHTLISAGFDTSAHALMWCLFLLGIHQDIQQQVYEEVVTETEGDIQYKDLSSLTYLECVIKEALRIYTPIPVFARYLRKDLQYGKFLIPKNTTVCVFPYMAHRNPNIYPDPEKFDPERFLGKTSDVKWWHHISFSEGNRICIGKNFAMTNLKIFLAHILRNFKIISLDKREDVEFTWGVVLRSQKKLRMKFVARH